VANLKEVLAQATELNRSIEQFLKFSTYDKYDDLSGLEMDRNDGEQLFLREELWGIASKLADVRALIKYQSRPIVEESCLRKGLAGKYRTAKGHYYDCRSVIEALVEDDYHNVPYWTRTVVDHNGKDFYLVGYEHVPMKGLRVRVRSTGNESWSSI